MNILRQSLRGLPLLGLGLFLLMPGVMTPPAVAATPLVPMIPETGKVPRQDVIKVRATDLDKTLNCGKILPNIKTTSMTLYLDTFQLPAGWDDPGSHFEVVTEYSAAVYASKDAAAPMCSFDGNWGTREFDIKNLYKGNWWSYRLDFNIFLNDVPVDGFVEFVISMKEEDTFKGADYIDLNPFRLHHLLIRAYPDQGIAYLVDVFDNRNITDSIHLVQFGKAKKVVGNGSLFAGKNTTPGTITFVLSRNDGYSPNPGIGKQVGGVKSTKACQTYAQTAIDLNGQAIAAGCNFAPPFWSGNYQEHFGWCMHGNNSAQADQANTDRQQQLASCKANSAAAAKDKGCRDYALTAVELNQQALALKCGFAPPVWSNDHQMHFDWCMRGNNNKSAANENTKRKAAIKTCQAQAAKDQGGKNQGAGGGQSADSFCQTYAHEAIDQFHVAQQRGCGFFGPEWSPDFNWHYNWCVQTYNAGQKSTIVAGRSKRSQMLAANCK